MTLKDDSMDRAGLEAARWLVALEEEPENVRLRAGFEAWLAADPAHAEAWKDTDDIYGMMGAVQPLPHRPAIRMLFRPLPAAAVAAIAACLALFAVPSMVLRLSADAVTAAAESRSVVLEDGSTVHLGPDSALAVTFGSQERRVHLVKGEAFFEVVRDPQRPFRVSAENVTATVLGTAFDVRLGETGATVAVRHGAVGVSHDAEGPRDFRRLEAGGWVRVGWDGQMQGGTVPADEVGAWQDGQLVARDRPLGDVVDDLRRYYGGLIIVTDEDFAARHVSGVYNLKTPEAALRALAGAHDGRVRALSPWILLVSGG